mmetsp:Transcript_16780/g.37112  ORF Transcript_16780/g.37112 Transcript_16780/m.37112 type:complete len:92 (-) Transcript_16780:8-283(-)
MAGPTVKSLDSGNPRKMALRNRKSDANVENRGNVSLGRYEQRLKKKLNHKPWGRWYWVVLLFLGLAVIAPVVLELVDAIYLNPASPEDLFR